MVPRASVDLVVEPLRLVFTIKAETQSWESLQPNILPLLFILLLPDNTCLFLYSFVPRRSLITETYSRASVVARLRL